MNGNNRKSVEALHQQEAKKGLFRWVKSSAASSVDAEVDFPCLDENFFSAAAFWRMLSDIVISQSQQQQTYKKDWYLALPDTTPSVVQHLCNILNWCTDLSK